MEPARTLSTYLLTLRAGRDRYYCLIDARFVQHPATMQALCQEARGLAPSMNGIRRRGHMEPERILSANLLTLRAGRDRYYYGIDARFEQHPATIQAHCQEARGLAPSMDVIRRRGHMEPERILSTILLTLRAGRDRFYHRTDARFEQHPATT